MWCHKIHFAHILPNPTWRRRFPNTWVVLEKKGGSRHFFLKRETCWTSFFPCHGLATAGGEQCNQPPWENIVVRPPLMTLDWIWRDAGGGILKGQREGRFSCKQTLSMAFFFFKRSIWKVFSPLKSCLQKHISTVQESERYRTSFPLY